MVIGMSFEESAYMNEVRRKALRDVINGIQRLSDELEALCGEEEEYRDSIPENMQGSERYEKAVKAVDMISEAVDNLRCAADNIESAIE